MVIYLASADLAIPQVDALADIKNVVLEHFWNIESISIVDKQTKDDDFIAMEKFKESVEFKGGRYYVKLMKGKALRKHSLHEKTAASVLLKLFISSNE